MKYWITTDTHFGHRRMEEFCGRPPTFEALILSGLHELTFDDVLIHLGDVCMGDDLAWHNQIKIMHCRKILVRGNHDKKSLSWYMEHGWDFACDSFSLKYEGKTILFSHIPVKDVGQYDLNVHGHFHNMGHHMREPELVAIKSEKQILLAIEDTKYKPVTLDSLIHGHG